MPAVDLIAAPSRQRLHPLLLATAACVLVAAPARAEDGSAAWLRYAPLANPAPYASLPSRIAVLGDTPTDRVAAQELQRGLSSMLGRNFVVLAPAESAAAARNAGNAIVLSPGSRAGATDTAALLQSDSYTIATTGTGSRTTLTVTGGSPRGELYGVFHVLEEVASTHPIADECQIPAAPIRWTDEWDNLNGTIERGYAGYMHPGDALGLGVELKEDLASRYPYQRAYLPVARLLDGTLTDW